MGDRIINKRPSFNMWRLSKWNPFTGMVRYSEQERLENDINCSVLSAINSIAIDRIMKVADMIKGSNDQQKREKYHIKRDYYKHSAKRAVAQMYEACKVYDRSVSRRLHASAGNDSVAENYILRALDMLDYSDEYLKNDFLNIRNVIRKESKKVCEPEDLTMSAHLVESIAIAGIVKVVYSHFVQITPVIGQVVDFGMFDGEKLWRSSQNALMSVDLRFARGSKADLADVLCSEAMEKAIHAIRENIYSIEFLNGLYEHRDGTNPHFENHLPADALINGYGKIDGVIIDNGVTIDTINRM